MKFQRKISLWFLPVAALLTGAGVSSSERGQNDLRLEIDLSERKLYVHNGNETIRSYAVAVGDPEHRTPEGSFTIGKIIWDPAWVPPPNAEWAEGKEKKEPSDPDNPMQAAKLYFKYPDYYIHGTEAVHTLGEAESHGCIRMDPSDVENLAILVQENGGEPRSDAWYKRMIRQEAESHTITLPNEVPVTIHE